MRRMGLTIYELGKQGVAKASFQVVDIFNGSVAYEGTLEQSKVFDLGSDQELQIRTLLTKEELEAQKPLESAGDANGSG